MKLETEQKGFREFDWQVPSVVTSLAQGKDAKELYHFLDNDIGVNYGDVDSIKVVSYDSDSKSLVGSNIFVASRLGELLREDGLRVAVPADDRNGDISRLVKGRFYTDFNALVLRSNGDSYKRNDAIAKDLAEKVEEREGKLRLPVMIVSPVVRYWADNEVYRLRFELDENSSVVENERLDGKYNGKRFDKVDDLGLPRFDKNGKRTWYARTDGLSRLFLGRYLDLDSSDVSLVYSDGDGRVVLVGGGATSQNFQGRIIGEVNREYKSQLAELNARREKALGILKGK